MSNSTQNSPSYVLAVIQCLVVALCCFSANLSLAQSLPELVKKIKPSIVGVGTYIPTRRPQQSILGTGFVVAGGRYIITNNHVVPELDFTKKEQLTVISGTGKKAKVHAVDIIAQDKINDLALLRLKKSSLASTQLSQSKQVEEGTSIFFIGFPIGSVLGVYPVTHRGIISAITPNVIPQDSASRLSPQMIRRLREPFGVFQLDATAYPGNSGSPVFNEEGRVIGVVNKVLIKETKESILAKPSGITYAIPVHFVKALLKKAKVK